MTTQEWQALSTDARIAWLQAHVGTTITIETEQGDGGGEGVTYTSARIGSVMADDVHGAKIYVEAISGESNRETYTILITLRSIIRVDDVPPPSSV